MNKSTHFTKLINIFVYRRFIRTADKYVAIVKIDRCMLRELIKAIYMKAPDKSSGKRRQNILIQYDGIDFIPLEELAKKETA